jgi:hypothetical protein
MTIDFEVCRKNWVDFVNSSDDFEGSNLTAEKSNCVGWRDYFDDPRYIEIFADIRVKVIFPRKMKLINKLLHYRLATKDQKEFHELQFKINKVGWKTFDLG